MEAQLLIQGEDNKNRDTYQDRDRIMLVGTLMLVKVKVNLNPNRNQYKSISTESIDLIFFFVIF